MFTDTNSNMDEVKFSLLGTNLSVCSLPVLHSNDFFSKFWSFYSLLNAEFRKDFRYGNNSSVTSKLPSLLKFKNIFPKWRSNDFFSKFWSLYGSLNAEFRKDFRHGNNSSVTSKLPSLLIFKNLFPKCCV